MRTGPRALGAFLLALVLAACAGTHRAAPVPAAAGGPAVKLVTIGGSATEGDGLADRLREAWPYLVYHDAFGRASTLVNAALDDATVENAISQQLPLVQEVKPDVVAIWLGADDLRQSTPMSAFTSGLTALIDGVRAVGTRTILVATLPLSLGPGATKYDASIRDVVMATHSVLVELQRSDVPLTSPDRFPAQPNAAGQRVVARAFADALRTNG